MHFHLLALDLWHSPHFHPGQPWAQVLAMSWVGFWPNLLSTNSLSPSLLFYYFYQPIQSRKTWRSSFFLLTGLVFLILLSGLYSIDPDLPSQETDKRVDWIGAFFVTSGLVLIVFVLGQGEIAHRQWATPCTYACWIKKSFRLIININTQISSHSSLLGSYSWASSYAGNTISRNGLTTTIQHTLFLCLLRLWGSLFGRVPMGG